MSFQEFCDAPQLFVDGATWHKGEGVRNFLRNRCPLRSSALAYTSLLALVPMLAVVLSVSSSLLKSQGEKQIETFIEKICARCGQGDLVEIEVDIIRKIR